MTASPGSPRQFEAKNREGTTSASMIWNEGILDFHVFGWGPVVVRRYLDREQLIWEYADGSKEIEHIPAEIWRNGDEVSKVFIKQQEVVTITMDPYLETADVDLNNNSCCACRRATALEELSSFANL